MQFFIFSKKLEDRGTKVTSCFILIFQNLNIEILNFKPKVIAIKKALVLHLSKPPQVPKISKYVIAGHHLKWFHLRF